MSKKRWDRPLDHARKNDVSDFESGVDIDRALKMGECVDRDGRRVTQADVLVGGFM